MYTFQKGINLGGWLSQYDDLVTTSLHDHFDTFITKKDIETIASWGADHVRLPVESTLLEDESLQYMEKCMEWAQQYGLGVILDLHHVKGMTWDPNLRFNPLFLPENTQRMLDVWQKISNYFAKADDGIRYELINEITDGTGYLWNELYPRVLEQIRQTEPNRVIYVGSNKMNDINYLSSLKQVDDDHIIYNFHYYEPHPFTHQRAPFDASMKAFDHAYAYPSDLDGLLDYMRQDNDYARKYPYLAFQRNDLAQMRAYLEKAEDFLTYAKKPLYCGEFGVIDQADPVQAAAWVKDFVGELRRLNIGYAYWCYKVRDFGIVDIHSQMVMPTLPEALFG